MKQKSTNMFYTSCIIKKERKGKEWQKNPQTNSMYQYDFIHKMKREK